jgi:hypothetical protein
VQICLTISSSLRRHECAHQPCVVLDPPVPRFRRVLAVTPGIHETKSRPQSGSGCEPMTAVSIELPCSTRRCYPCPIPRPCVMQQEFNVQFFNDMVMQPAQQPLRYGFTLNRMVSYWSLILSTRSNLRTSIVGTPPNPMHDGLSALPHTRSES